MSRIIYADDKYKILKNYSGCVLINKKGKYKNHGHFRKKETCFLMIKLMEKKEVPKSSYLRESALRISLDEKYKKNIQIKIKKDSNKKYYTNIQKGSKVVYG